VTFLSTGGSRGRVLAKAPFRKFGRRWHGTLQREERQWLEICLWTCLGALGLRVWETVLCNAFRCWTKREGTRLPDGFTLLSRHCNIWNSQPYLNPIACLLTMFTWPFVSRRVCGKIYRSQPTSPHSNLFSQTSTMRLFEKEQLVGGGRLQTSYQGTIYISRACAEQLHETYGQWFFLCWRLEDWTEWAERLRNKQGSIRWVAIVLCMTYLGWVGTYEGTKSPSYRVHC